MTPNLARSNRQIRALWLRKPPMNSTDLGDKDPQQVTRFKIKQAMFDSTNCFVHRVTSTDGRPSKFKLQRSCVTPWTLH